MVEPARKLESMTLALKAEPGNVRHRLDSTCIISLVRFRTGKESKL